jgi:hypothetical protein
METLKNEKPTLFKLYFLSIFFLILKGVILGKIIEIQIEIQINKIIVFFKASFVASLWTLKYFSFLI